MPCFRCGARQTDPDPGVTAWRRGVRADAHVLICPDCQPLVDLDHCGRCGAVTLVCRLGEVECRACGHVRMARPGTTPAAPPSAPAALSAEVEAALARVLGRRP